MIDQPGPVRVGEELDAARLSAYLSTVLPDAAGELKIAQFPGGFSNLTYGLEIGGRELVLRRPPFGERIQSAHDMGREFRILRALYPVYPKVPRTVAFCDDESVLGCPFYLMERMRGVVLRASVPDGLTLSPEVLARLSTNFITNLAEIHAVDYQRAGLESLGRPEGYVKRQVEGWMRRYANARTSEVPGMDELAVWLTGHLPAERGACLIHNDYKYDNLLLDEMDQTRITGVFDWEMATIGDPLMDLGTALGYWVDPGDPSVWKDLGFGLTALPGNLNRRQLAEAYAELTGRPVAGIVYYYVFALYKLAVIIQQIYKRYQQGYSQDPRFAALGERVTATAAMALHIRNRGEL